MKKTLLIGLILFAVGGFIYENAEPPECVQNTLIAAEWAEENLGVMVASGSSCMYAVNQYLKAHNLTDEEFPTCCWSSDEGPPMSLEEKVGFSVFLAGLSILVYCVLSFSATVVRKVVEFLESRWKR